MLRLPFALFIVSLFVHCVKSASEINSYWDMLSTDNQIIEVFNDCSCVYYYQCDENNFIITDGSTLIAPRAGEGVTRIKCKGGKFEGQFVCCKLNGTKTKDDIKTNPKSPEVVDPLIENVTEKPQKKLCGIQRTIINVRVFAGEDELVPMKGEFPWIAAIFRKDALTGAYTFYCSGSLIHPKVILTANHYFHRKTPSEFRVVLNGNIELPYIGQNVTDERNVVEIVNHPDYYAGALYNDGALLFLDEPYVKSKQNSINNICLPPEDVNMDNVNCLVAGWGKGSEKQGQRVLKKVELPYVNHASCQNLLRKTRLGTLYELHESFVCAGGEEGKDACKGDGGSPLMCPFPSENRYFQAGIVSWGIGCGTANTPGVYANVAEFKSWIDDELDKRDLTIHETPPIDIHT